MHSYSPFLLPELSKWHQKKFLCYATQILEAQQRMTNNSVANILQYVLNKHDKYDKYERMTHYPKGDRIDRTTGAQYFYHCHRENHETTEHGHFHCFLRYKYIPRRVKPTALADWDRYIDNPMTHLVAIGINQYGFPIRLFTVNRWVSCEVWYDALHAPYFIKRYKMTLADDPYWQILDSWIEGMLHLFAPQIAWLYQERDRAIQRYQAEYPLGNAYSNEHLEELSSIDIDIKEQVEWVLGS